MQMYQDALNFHRRIVQLTRAFPKDFEYLKNQLRRSSLSVVLNIAEGSAKNSDKEFNRYVVIALGSINESMAGCDVAAEEKLITQSVFKEVESLAETLTRQLGGFSKTLKSKI